MYCVVDEEIIPFVRSVIKILKVLLAADFVTNFFYGWDAARVGLEF